MIIVDVQKILRNVDRVRAMLGPGVKLCAVVKGDAYGCGDVRFSRVLERSGKVDLLAVAMADEGLHLRQQGIRMPILILSDCDDNDVPLILKNDLIPTIYRAAFAERLNAAAERPVAAHVRADVCMGSPGIEPAKLPDMLRTLDAMPNIRVEGLYTQIYAAYTDDHAAAQEQLDRFQGVVNSLEPALRRTLCVHAASTPAALNMPGAHFDMVRVGAALYGLPVDDKPNPFEPVMAVRSHIVSIKAINGEGYTGYARVGGNGRRTLATVMGGYEDALYLMFAKQGAMLVRGQFAPIVGDPSMDSTTIDITGIQDAALGDEVVLLGAQGDREITIADIMAESGFRMANCQLVYKSGKRVKREYVNEPGEHRWLTLLGQVFDHAPAVRGVLTGGHRERTLRQYVRETAEYEPAQGPQPAFDIGRAIERHIAAYAGEEAAREAASAAMQGLFTANHHGVDCFPQSVQGNLIYRALLRARGHRPDILPVLACSGVPMDNSSYGRGLMAFDTLGESPLRLPLLPSRRGSCIVGLYSAIEPEGVRRMLDQLRAGRYADRLDPKMQKAIEQALGFYLDPGALAANRYTDQAEYVNLRLTERAFGQGVAYINLEQIAAELLLADLRDPQSLYYQLLFDPPVWRAVLEELSGATGCWDFSAWRGGDYARAGTVLFWGCRKNCQRYPLTYEDGMLVSHQSGVGEFRVEPNALAGALEEGRLYPGLFSVFAPIVFARGMRVFGGCFQPEYLRGMREGLTRALRAQGRAGLAEKVARADVSGYLSGPLFLTNPDTGSPLGILELCADPPAAGALDAALDIPLWEAHRRGLMYLYADTVPAGERPTGWREMLA